MTNFHSSLFTTILFSKTDLCHYIFPRIYGGKCLNKMLIYGEKMLVQREFCIETQRVFVLKTTPVFGWVNTVITSMKCVHLLAFQWQVSMHFVFGIWIFVVGVCGWKKKLDTLGRSGGHPAQYIEAKQVFGLRYQRDRNYFSSEILSFMKVVILYNNVDGIAFLFRTQWVAAKYRII